MAAMNGAELRKICIELRISCSVISKRYERRKKCFGSAGTEAVKKRMESSIQNMWTMILRAKAPELCLA
jgi:hypothetical protein